jgi:ABC-type phosphate/phosphonate transport system substrate-binding protein
VVPVASQRRLSLSLIRPALELNGAEPMRLISLPMYSLPEMATANAAFWDELRERLGRRGADRSDLAFDHERRPVPDGIEPEVLFTQICGYPLFKRYRQQALMLAVPCYNFPGCDGPTHRAYFMVRSGDSAERLEDLRGRVFGCNSLLSNSGMNLPRLSLARIAQGQPFFSSVVMTGGHGASLDRLAEGSIDVCSIDTVTWGFFAKFRPDAAAQFRIVDETVSSPSLPFVTSSAASDGEAAMISEILRDIFADPSTASFRSALEITALAAPDVTAYERLAVYERESAELGYPEIR